MLLVFFDYFYPAVKAGGPIQSGLAMNEILKKAQRHFKIITRSQDIDGTPLDTSQLIPEVLYLKNYSILQVARMISDSSIIVLNSIFSVKFSILPLFIALILKKDIIVYARGELYGTARNKGKWFLKSIYLSIFRLFKGRIKFIATNDSELEVIRSMGHEVSLLRVSRNDLLQYSKPQKDVSRVLHDFGVLGRFSPIKNQLGFLEALESLGSSRSVLLKGPKENPFYASRCEELAKKLNVKIDYSYDQVEEFYSSVKFIVIPSLSENFGHVIFEAACRGIPVLSNKGVPVWFDSQLSFDLNNLNELSCMLESLPKQKDSYLDLSNQTFRDCKESLAQFRTENVNFFGDL